MPALLQALVKRTQLALLVRCRRGGRGQRLEHG
jgi:hypothetical protein